jgi:hypothetical protein
MTPAATVDVPVLRARVAALMPQLRTDLEDLVRIPSVSAPAFDQAQVVVPDSPTSRSCVPGSRDSTAHPR